MLNISTNSVRDSVDLTEYKSFQLLEKNTVSKALLRVLIVTSIIATCALFLPWTQNIRSTGEVTTVNPDARPQAIQSLIDGRIAEWHVREGQLVQKGDTILRVEEAKETYLDPELIDRTAAQVDAKKNAAEAYQMKAQRLEDQYYASIKARDNELEQNAIKIRQTILAIQSDSLELSAEQVQFNNANKQYQRAQNMYDRGLISLTDLEIKELSKQKAQAKLTKITNDIAEKQQELSKLLSKKELITNKYDEKLAKIQADRSSTLSNNFAAIGEMNKLQSNLNNYKFRRSNYIIRAPITGYITEVEVDGVGEYVKGGESILTIMPKQTELAVEIYIRPQDMPLMQIGQKVRIQFDGWPAIVFSGWPENSYGTFAGEVFAIDQNISPNGKFRILAKETEGEQAWPNLVRVGGGARSIILLNEVPLYYEIWRQLNGFPPDFYAGSQKAKKEGKAPLRKVK